MFILNFEKVYRVKKNLQYQWDHVAKTFFSIYICQISKVRDEGVKE